MPEDGAGALAIQRSKATPDRAKAAEAPLGILDSVEDLIKRSRGDAPAIRAGIQSAVLGALAVAAALSMIPFEFNFGSVLAGNLGTALMSPAVSKAINAPISDYLDNIFPVGELNVRMLVTGIEKGALSDEEVIDTAVDSGIKDKEIKKLLKIAKMSRFMKETAEDYAMLDRYQDAMISAQITNARAEIDDAIAERKALLTEWKKLAAEEAMEAAALGISVREYRARKAREAAGGATPS